MPLITAETAREYQSRAAESRRRNRQAGGNGEPQDRPLSADDMDEFRVERLACTRAQIEAVDSAISKEFAKPEGVDALNVERLARAKVALVDVEMLLRREPKPGCLRPTDKPARSGIAAELGG